MLKAIDTALPKDTRPPEERKETAEDIAQRTELHIESMDCEYFADVSGWFAGIKPIYDNAPIGRDAEAVVEAATAAAEGETPAAEGGDAAATAEPTGEPAPAEETTAAEASTETPAAEATATETPAETSVAEPVADATTMPADPALDPAAAGAVDPVTGLPIEGAAGGDSPGKVGSSSFAAIICTIRWTSQINQR